jgi:hypothetical protein
MCCSFGRVLETLPLCVLGSETPVHMFPLFPSLLLPLPFSIEPWAASLELTAVLDPIRGDWLKIQFSFVPSKICFDRCCLPINQGSPVPTWSAKVSCFLLGVSSVYSLGRPGMDRNGLCVLSSAWLQSHFYLCICFTWGEYLYMYFVYPNICICFPLLFSVNILQLVCTPLYCVFPSYNPRPYQSLLGTSR